MSITNGYATTTQLNTRLGQAFSSGNNFTLLEDCIEAASRFIDRYTGSFFYTKTLSSEKLDRFAVSDSELFISDDGVSIMLPVPVISISSITEDGTALTENTDYYVYSSSYKIDREGVWTSARRGIAISGSIGYAATPKRIENLCLTIAEVMTGLGVRTVTDSEGSVQDIVMRSIPKWVFSELDLEKRVVV